MSVSTARAEELRSRLKAVQDRISTTAARLHRDEPTLVVVTKFHPAADVAHLHSLGVRDVGENRDQEASAKAAELQELDLRWHFIGQIQTNKAKSVARYASAVHSVDRESLATALDKALRAQEDAGGVARQLDVFLQVNLDPAAEAESLTPRGGIAPSQLLRLADLVVGLPTLKLRGLMAVAPLGEDPDAAFARLARLAEALRREHPAANQISAGMSHDLEAAMEIGATHLRIGTDVLGPRPGMG